MPIDGERVPLILTLPDLDAYLRDRNYMGQLIGRYANRIANATFELDGETCQLTSNDGKHALHGGSAPFGRENWKVLSAREGKAGFVRLSHFSPEGSAGFPGNLKVIAAISLTGNSIRLEFEAESDAPTPISFTWHPYFNLSGSAGAAVSSHQLRLAAASYLPVDTSWIPTGEIAPVEGTRFDYRSYSQVGTGSQRFEGQVVSPLNQCFVVDRNASVVAEVYCPRTGIHMELRSDLPGIQVYDGHYLNQQYPGWHGLSLEPSGYPDAPNRRNFPCCILRPGHTHRSFMSYTFRRVAP